MSVQPTGTIVPAPAVPAGVDQLPDIANVISNNDPHLMHGGSYESACGLGTVIPGVYPCAPRDLNQGVNELVWVQGWPGIALTGVTCLGPISTADLQASAMLNIEQRTNRTIQDNIIGGFIPVGEFDQRTASDAGGLADADTVARCEYSGQAVIHINPQLAEQWMGKEIIRVGRHLETVMGALVSLNCWLGNDQIAVTGYLTVYKGANRVTDAIMERDANGQPINQWTVAVQTPVTVFNDCNLAVLINGATGGGGSDTPVQATVTSIAPNQVQNVKTAKSITVTGTDFTKTSVIEIDGEDVSTQYQSPTTLLGLFVPYDVSDGVDGTYPVTVIGATGSAPLQIVPAPLPLVIMELQPTSVRVGDDELWLRVIGSGFTDTTVIHLGGAPTDTIFQTDTMVQTLFDPATAFEGNLAVTVREGNEISNVLYLAVTPAPVVPTYLVTKRPKTYPPVPYEPGGGGLKIEQTSPNMGIAADSEITSISWGDGSPNTVAPYTRTQGYITHTFTSHGTVAADGTVPPLPYAVDFTNPGAPDATGTFDVHISYYLGYLPSPPNLIAGGTLQIRPIDDYQGPPINGGPDKHFVSVDWGDGSPVQTPPFTVDGSGYATHVYPVVGTYNVQIEFLGGQQSGLNTGVTTTVVATQEELDSANATWEAEHAEDASE